MFNTSRYNTFENVQKPLYIARKKEVTRDEYNNEIVKYDIPFFFDNINYQYLTGNDLQAYMSVYGETKNKLVRAFIDINHKGKFKEFDKAYLFGTIPPEVDEYGKKANYVVKTYAEQNTKIMVVFEEIIKGE